eukprot:TRINITY_DN11805_c0_g1_i1.p1 TRINITY_DN11805_c0_g1~~TRINITY_DN11805_c0_g1_i1.p1  ORF type:complete len:246 (+),score=31.15 TRINITY_DN11805_c0_g1_i1:463-1200(+)
MKTSNKRLVVFDFDWSLLDENSDTYAIRKLLDISASDRLPSRETDEQWADYMNRMMQKCHDKGIRKLDIEQVFQDIPLLPAMADAIKHIHSNNCETAIISGANVIFIDIILKQHNLQSFFPIVDSHIATWTNEERLHIKGFHNSDNPHTCKLCTADLCKGDIMQKQHLRADKNWEQVIYVGDSRNDLCAILQLKPGDVAFVRENFVLHKTLSTDAKLHNSIKSQIQYWRDAAHFNELITKLLAEN